MKVLLDECLPRKLKQDLTDHRVRTVSQMGWGGIKNGALLRLAQARFDVFITTDQNLKYQQNIPTVEIAVVVLFAGSNRWKALHPLMPAVRAALPTVRNGETSHIKG